MGISIVGNGKSCIGGKAKVLIDGVPMKGVNKVELVADCSVGVWRAVIHVMPDVVEVSDLDDTVARFVSTKATDGLTAEERSRLFGLLQEPRALSAIQSDADVTLLRDQMWAIAEAKGWTWEQVCADMGIRLSSLAA